MTRRDLLTAALAVAIGIACGLASVAMVVDAVREHQQCREECEGHGDVVVDGVCSCLGGRR